MLQESFTHLIETIKKCVHAKVIRKKMIKETEKFTSRPYDTPI